ncbi:CdaR family protein [Coprobacillaceae bacterium CR2/5/TPMF4]|nr:CdaR family protein [Coprobacillaceae bacterium CR2/5/TPMF4]
MLAIILLLTINGSITNIFTAPNGGDYLYDVPIKVEGLQSDYDVVGLPETVNVALVGPSLDIYTTKISGNYEVIADFSTLGEGEHTIELKSEGFPNDLQVMIVPQTVTVRITQKVTKTFELGYDFINEDKMDEKYSVSVESMEHNAVEVQGSQDDIDRINSVMATIDLDGVNKNFEQDARIHAYDRSGEEVDVEIIPKTVKVNCSVSSYSKEVPITPTYTGQFASGYGLENITLSKDRVRIYGKEELLNSINEVHVEIDISNVSSNKTYERLQITGTENINKMDFDTIDAQIQVGSTTTTTISDIPINVINNENNYKVNFASGQDKAL